MWMDRSDKPRERLRMTAYKTYRLGRIGERRWRMSGEKLIFHVDVNSAFLSWEAVERLKHPEQFPEITVDLRDIPSAVGGDRSKRHGIILAKSIPAKKYKVQTGEPITDALKKCPNLVLVPSRHGIYREYSRAFISILKLSLIHI